MQTIYIHIGPHKTGSTSVQSWAQASTLAFSNADVYFPFSGRNIDGNHSELAWSISGDERSKASVFYSFLQEIRGRRESKIFISGEEFEYLSTSSVASLRSLLGDMDVKVIITLRPQHEIIRSQYGEWLKQFLTCDDFSSFWRIHRHFPEYDFLSLVKRWSSSFGFENIIVKSLDEEKRSPSGIISAICHLLGVDEENTVTEPIKNSSEVAEVLFLWRYMLLKVQMISGSRTSIQDETLGSKKLSTISRLRGEYSSVIEETRRLYYMGDFVRTPFQGYSSNELKEVQAHFSGSNEELFLLIGRQLWDYKIVSPDLITYPIVPDLAMEMADDLFNRLKRSRPK